MQAEKKKVQDFWNSEACGERYGEEQDAVRYRIEPEILEFAAFDEAAGKRVLEIGVGMGADFTRWGRAGARAIGVDLTERAAGLTNKRLHAEGLENSCSVAIGDAEQLPFPDTAFDQVYSWGVLHHTPDTAAAVQEAIRVLRPGGHFKVMMYHRRSFLALAAWIRFGPLRGRPFVSLSSALTHMESPGTQAFTRTEVGEMLDGLEDVSISTRLTYWDRKWWKGITKLGGHRFGWFLLIEGTRST
jgi:ubiquinone/menaquinone biosynthesis C-methylase UbiE